MQLMNVTKIYKDAEEEWEGIKGIKFFLNIQSAQRSICIQKFLALKIEIFLT